MIVPSTALPPGTPLTLQLTEVSVVFVTIAVNVAWPPSTNDPVAGVTVTMIDAGGGGGGGGALAEPQPRVHAPSASSAVNTIVLVLKLFLLRCERDRIPSQKQAKGQRRGEVIGAMECRRVNSARREETALNEHFGEFQESGFAFLSRTELDPDEALGLSFVLIWNWAGTALFQFGTGPSGKFLR